MSVDPVREGYAKVKSKHLGAWNKRWLKLRPACSGLPNRLEKYQDEDSAIARGDRATYDLSDVRYVDRMKAKDKKHAVCIVLQNYDVVQFALSSDLEANSWLQDLQRLLFGKTDVASMFEVYLMKAPQLNNASGECLLQVTEDSVRLLDIDNPRRVQLELPLATIRRYSTERGMIRLETGRSSPVGEGELMFDSTDTEAIYNSIQRATKEMVNRAKNKSTAVTSSSAAPVTSPTDRYDDDDVVDPQRMTSTQRPSHKKTTSSSVQRGNSSNASTKSRQNVYDDNCPPQYDDDSPPPYTAPGLPLSVKSTSRTGSSKSSSQYNQSQEYVEPIVHSSHTSGQRSMTSSRSKSDSTYSRSAGSDVNSFKRSAASGGRNREQFDEELPIYNSGQGGSDDIYTADDNIATSRAGPTRCASDVSGRKANRFINSSETPYDLETDYHGVSGQRHATVTSSSSSASRRGGNQSQYSVPNKFPTTTTAQQFDQYDNNVVESYYDDASSSSRRGASRSGQGQGQNWSAGDVSGSFTDRVQASLSLDPTSAPQLPPRKGQPAKTAKPVQRADTEDQVFNDTLERIIVNDLNLRPSLLVDRVELS